MAAPADAPSGTEALALLDELERLTAEWYAVGLAGDDGRLDHLIDRVAALLARLASIEPPPGAVGPAAATLRQVLARTEHLLALLAAEREQVRRQLAALAEQQRWLRAYGGSTPATPVFIERHG